MQNGFTLVELMIVVTIVGLLAGMGLPVFRKVRERTQNTATFNDLRIFAQAFQTYALANGKWPLASGPGVLPAEMEGEIKKSFFHV